MLRSHGVRPPHVAYAATIEDAKALLRSSVKSRQK
jgi:SulP family sulfate permease